MYVCVYVCVNVCRTYDYVERELTKVPENMPVLVLANHRDMGHHRTVTDDQVRTHIEHLDRSAAVEQSIFTCEGIRERTEDLDIFLFFCPSLHCVLFPMFCLLVEGECQILVIYKIISSILIIWLIY